MSVHCFALKAARRIGLGVGLLGLSVISACGGGDAADSGKGVVVITEPDKLAVSGTPSAAAPVTGEASTSSEPAAASTAAVVESSPAPGATAEGWGTLKGRLVFVGDMPTFQPLVVKGSDVKDAQVCGKEDIPNEKLVVDPATKGVRHALVYIPKPTAVNPEALAAAEKATVEFDQRNCVFLPHVLGVVKGGKMLIKSSDQVGHNVHSLLRGTNFNQGLQPGSTTTLEIRNADGRPGQVVCDIHPWMKAWWLTLNNPYFAVTNEKGEFEIRNVPAGEQKVVVWSEATHPAFISGSAQGDPVTIAAGGETTVEFKLDAAKVK